MFTTRKTSLATALAASFILYACGGGGGGSDSSTSSGSSSTTTSSSSSAAAASTYTASNTVTGWASYYTDGGSLTGGASATTAKTYTVTTRKELLDALYNGTETVASNGTFSGGTLDSDPKIIYISGTISLNTNLAGTELTADDYVSRSCASDDYTSADAMWAAYYAAFSPSVWTDMSTEVSGTPETARACAATAQKEIVNIQVPSNTSIIGLNSDAIIEHGNLILGDSNTAVENIIIRNVNFQDAFDFFPQWDPTDSSDTGRWNSNYDLITVYNATHVWIDHNEFSDGARTDDLYPSVWTGEASDGTNYATNEVYKIQHHDATVDIIKASNYITVSYNYFHDHDKNGLVGNTDSASTSAENPDVLKVTFDHNYYKDIKQRQPRVRYGMVHVYNNYYNNEQEATEDETLDTADVYGWSVGWTAGQASKIYAESNAFTLPSTFTVASIYAVSISSSKISSCESTGTGYSEAACSSYFYDADTYLNGTKVDVTKAITNYSSYVTSDADGAYWKPSTYYSYTLDDPTTLSTTIPEEAGVGKL